MCIISAEERESERQRWLNVTKTNIFARHTGDGYQALAYSLSIASKTAAAMILPLPVTPGCGEDGLSFIDLGDYEDFFNHLKFVCEPEEDEDFEELSLGDLSEDEPTLTVYEVGDYEASYVPTMADFSRLDPRFRVREEIWRKMPDYSDYGFAVFQLKLVLTTDGEARENTIHPMAFEFRTRDTERLYFPTVHVHDGDYHAEAGFYHRFYCQRPDARAEFKAARLALGELPPSLPSDDKLRFMAMTREQFDETYVERLHWYYRSSGPAGSEVLGLPIERSHGLIDPDAIIHCMDLHGDFPNQDIWLGL